MLGLLFFLIHFFILCQLKVKKVDESKCGTCFTILNEIKQQASSEIDQKDINGFTEKFKKYCASFSYGSPQERFCYNVGARPDSSTSLMKNILNSFHLPTNKVCMDLHLSSEEICRDKVKIVVDWNNLNQYSVKVLNQLLTERGDQCFGCTEKTELIDKLKTHKPSSEL